jgi:hypothetical protein
MDLTTEEQETHVWGNRASDEWEIYTADPKNIRRFTRLKYPVVSSDRFGIRFKVPLRVIRFGRLEKRKMSDNQKMNVLKAQAAIKNIRDLKSSGDQNDQALTRPLPEKVD